MPSKKAVQLAQAKKRIALEDWMVDGVFTLQRAEAQCDKFLSDLRTQIRWRVEVERFADNAEEDEVHITFDTVSYVSSPDGPQSRDQQVDPTVQRGALAGLGHAIIAAARQLEEYEQPRRKALGLTDTARAEGAA